jgi:hypothetical protein
MNTKKKFNKYLLKYITCYRGEKETEGVERKTVVNFFLPAKVWEGNPNESINSYYSGLHIPLIIHVQILHLKYL